MDRTQKAEHIEQIKDHFSKASLVLVTDYKGLSVNSFNELRLKLRVKNSEIKVVKNRLTIRALKGSPFESLSEHLKGTTAVTTTQGDPTRPAKVLVDFAKENEQMKFKIGTMEGKILSFREVEALAKLPSREELIAKIMSSMLAPARNLVSAMAQIPRQLVNVLAAVRDQKEKES